MATRTISTLEELKAFRDEVNAGNEFKGETIELANDIDLGGEEWTPIGHYGGGSFYGTFNGNGHTIKGLNIGNQSYGRGTGFFGETFTAVIKDLPIEGNINTNTDYVGGIVGYKNNGWLYYSYNSGMVVSSEDRASGIAGYNANVSTSVIVSYNVGFLIAPNKGTTAGISTTANSSKDCFYIDQDDREIVANGAAEKTEYFLSSEEFVSTLNGLSFSNIWTTDDEEVNDDYPVFKWEKIRY